MELIWATKDRLIVRQSFLFLLQVRLVWFSLACLVTVIGVALQGRQTHSVLVLTLTFLILIVIPGSVLLALFLPWGFELIIDRRRREIAVMTRRLFRVHCMTIPLRDLKLVRIQHGYERGWGEGDIYFFDLELVLQDGYERVQPHRSSVLGAAFLDIAGWFPRAETLQQAAEIAAFAGVPFKEQSFKPPHYRSRPIDDSFRFHPKND